jgi:hypothetical protein
LNSCITSGHKEKLILLPGYTDIAVGIEKLGLPSLEVPDLFLAEKISQSPVQHATDLSWTPSPPTSPPPPGLIHPSSARIVKPTIISQNLKENYLAPARRGSDPGIFNRTVIEGATSYKSVVQGKVLIGGGDGHSKSTVGAIRASTLGPSQMDNLEGAIMGANGHGTPPRRINPKIVELIEPLSFAMEMKLTIYRYGCASLHCSPFGSVSGFYRFREEPV